jgi:cytochrome c-type biogenesis protein CcmH/NrfG
MRWVVVDGVVAVLAVGVLALSALGLWRRVKALGRATAAAGSLLEQASAQRAQVSGPPVASYADGGASRVVRSTASS